ncbi:MAG TPA: hypothetical protein VN696_10015 [Pyrinomonadaceae bacterium]|nr:hypothetical protein [Pyrinomonadaceae bacterium]
MSDFLTRLAARAVGAAPVIQPRLPSLFESGAQSQRPIMEVNVQREAENIHHHQTVSPEVRQAGINDLPVPITTPVGEVEAAIKPEINRQPLHLELPATQQKEQADSVSQPAATSEISRSSRAAVEANNKASSSQIVERLHETKLEQTIVPRQHESEWPLIQPKVRQLISDQLSEMPTSRARDERSPDKETQLVRPSPPIVTPVPPPRIKPAEVLAREPSSISEAPPPLNVTIGRIDVRAVFTPAAQPTRVKDARPAATSLDEYLKKRSGVSR